MKMTQMPPVHAANLVTNSGNTIYGVDVISDVYRSFIPNKTTFTKYTVTHLCKVANRFYHSIGCCEACGTVLLNGFQRSLGALKSTDVFLGPATAGRVVQCLLSKAVPG